MSALPAMDSSPAPARTALLASAPGLQEALESWRARLAGAGIACRALALHAADPQYRQDFPPGIEAGLHLRWDVLRARIGEARPVDVSRPESGSGGDLLLATQLQLPDGQPGVIGLALPPPLNERTIELLLLALGWLQLALAGPRLLRSQRALRLLELLGHAASQPHAHAAAQEWINRSAHWAAQEAEQPASLTVSLFSVRRSGLPRWWVTADTAWVEKAAPLLQAATELATQAVVEQQDVQTPQAAALPVLDGGEVRSVLVVQRPDGSTGPLPPASLLLLRASLDLAEPLLRQWREAERGLLAHAAERLREGWRRLRDPGHLSFKFGAGVALLLLLALFALPVPERVTAHLVIEGRVRQLVSAPFDGFIGRVLVRPGQTVRRGEVLAVLDDRELKLEQARFQSEEQQAAGRLRQAMADHESAAQALALAEVKQAQAQLALVEARLARAQLVAPEDGLVVTGDWVQQIGTPVELGKELFELASGSGYRVVLHVPDRDIRLVHAGQGGTLRLAGQPQQGHDFRIANVTATASVQDGVNGFRVEADWIGAAPPLSPGMQGIGKIEVGTSNLFTVWTRHSIDWLRLKLWSWW